MSTYPCVFSLLECTRVCLCIHRVRPAALPTSIHLHVHACLDTHVCRCKGRRSKLSSLLFECSTSVCHCLFCTSVSLYGVRGTEATELLVSASIFFEDEGESVLVVRGFPEHDSAKEKDFRFPCSQIRRVRHHQPDMFQWMVSKGRGAGRMFDHFSPLLIRS